MIASDDSTGLGQRGVRPDWMFCAARECQLLAGIIALSDPRSVDVHAALGAAVPAPASDVERFILESLIARSLREIENRSFQFQLPAISTVSPRARPAFFAIGMLSIGRFAVLRENSARTGSG